MDYLTLVISSHTILGIHCKIEVYSHLSFTVSIIIFVWCIRYNALTNTAFALQKVHIILYCDKYT